MKNFVFAMFAALSMAALPTVAEAGGGGGGNSKSQPEIHIENTGNTVLAVAVNNSHAEAVSADQAQQAEFVARGGVVLHPGDDHTFKVNVGSNRVAYRAFNASTGAAVGGLQFQNIVLQRNEDRDLDLSVSSTSSAQ